MDYEDMKLVRDSFEKSAAKGTLNSEWNRIHEDFKNNPKLQAMQKELNATEQGKKDSDFMRELWAKYDMPSPTDFIFKDDAEPFQSNNAKDVS